MKQFIRYSLWLLILTASISCKKNADLPQGIRDLIKTYESGTCDCRPYIHQYQWNNKTIYHSSCSGPACSCVNVFYDESGKLMQMPEGFTFEEFTREGKLIRSVWSCK